MSKTFQFKDVLLQSEGQIPVYYWLFRNTVGENLPYIRDFLELFQRELASRDNDLSFLQSVERNEYKLASRSVNDRNSHQLRYKILNEVFSRWINSKSMT